MVKITKIKGTDSDSTEIHGLPIVCSGRLKTTELSGRGGPNDAADASPVCTLSDSQSRGEQLPLTSKEVEESAEVTPQSPWYVPVMSKTGQALMPCHPARARELVRKGKAVRRFKTGLFYIQLTERETGDVQEIAVGIDPGSKREAFTVKSESHTYLNVLSDAVTWVKESMEVRRNMRHVRRQRKTPCRMRRLNRSHTSLAPSTKARWQAKLRIIDILGKLYPIDCYVIEDTQARSRKGCKKWNRSFSPLEIGKTWFYGELSKLGNLEIKQGYETKELRDLYGLRKTKGKMDEKFSAHNVDSWILANWYIGGHTKPENERIFRLIPIQFHRRQLHLMCVSKGGLRRVYGSTVSNGIKRGSLVKHKTQGVCYAGGYTKKMGLSLHSTTTSERIYRSIHEKDFTVLCYNYFRGYCLAG